MNTYAQKVQAEMKGSEIVTNEDKTFSVKFSMKSDATAETVEMLKEKFIVEVEEPVVGTYTHCPHCGVHLDNGISTYDYQQEICKQHKSQKPAITKEFICLGCGEEFGEVVQVIEAPKKSAPTGEGLKIQKDREERNGLKRPSAGGICAQLWDLFDAMYAEKGMVPTPKPAKERSAELNLDPTTTQVQLYRWREFMGFKGK